MDILSIAILKEPRQIAAAAINEKTLLRFEVSADHIREGHQGALLEFHNLDLTCAINVNGETLHNVRNARGDTLPCRMTIKLSQPRCLRLGSSAWLGPVQP